MTAAPLSLGYEVTVRFPADAEQAAIAYINALELGQAVWARIDWLTATEDRVPMFGREAP